MSAMAAASSSSSLVDGSGIGSNDDERAACRVGGTDAPRRDVLGRALGRGGGTDRLRDDDDDDDGVLDFETNNVPVLRVRALDREEGVVVVGFLMRRGGGDCEAARRLWGEALDEAGRR